MGSRSSVMVDVHVQLHHLIHVEGLNTATSSHADGVADEMQGVVVLEEFRILREDWAFVWGVAVGFEGHQAFFAGAAEEFVHHFHGFEVFFLGKLRSAKSAGDAADDGFEDVEGVRDQHRADGGAANDDEFRRLHEDLQGPFSIK
jgi:hypothetical protein